MIIVNIITILVSSPLVSMMAHSLLLVAEVVLLPGVEVAVLRTVARAVRHQAPPVVKQPVKIRFICKIKY